ncbi:rab9 effector protein [Anaeramoeba flamelloides]|uniref:Rab9 effector protein n=1 Tax=Anaeramoeba flamelloides TaxID=1746091 RepID=A0ABQ8X8R6_9EUKA|nr:rab9 effector protein [Anaeramoeba flamelloides]
MIRLVEGALDFILASSNSTYIFIANSRREKKNWLKAIKQVLDEQEQKVRNIFEKVEWAERETHGISRLPTTSGKGCIYKNTFYTFGGKIEMNENTQINNSLDCLDLKTWEWNVLKPLKGKEPSPRYSHSLSLIGNKIYIFGGNSELEKLGDFHIYDIDKNEWDNDPQYYGKIPSARSGHSAAVIGNQFWVFGGRGKTQGFLNDLHCFDINSMTFYEILGLDKSPPPRAWHTANFYENQMILFGGSSRSKTFEDIWVYDLTTFQWYESEISGRKPHKRYFHSSVLIQDRLYFIGGDSTYGKVDDIAVLDFNSVSWDGTNEIGEPPQNKSKHITSVIDEKEGLVLLYGPGNNNDSRNSVYILNVKYQDPYFDKSFLKWDKFTEQQDSKYIDYEEALKYEFFNKELAENNPEGLFLSDLEFTNEKWNSDIYTIKNTNNNEKNKKTKKKRKIHSKSKSFFQGFQVKNPNSRKIFFLNHNNNKKNNHNNNKKKKKKKKKKNNHNNNNNNNNNNDNNNNDNNNHNDNNNNNLINNKKKNKKKKIMKRKKRKTKTKTKKKKTRKYRNFKNRNNTYNKKNAYQGILRRRNTVFTESEKSENKELNNNPPKIPPRRRRYTSVIPNSIELKKKINSPLPKIPPKKKIK